MECPTCRHPKTEIYNSRPSSNARVWRRRRCEKCEHVFTTYENWDLSYISVRHSEGSQEPYARLELQTSIYQACGERPDYAEAVDSLVGTIEHQLLEQGKDQVATAEISQAVLSVLKRYDPAIFMRYLSQRDDFTSLQQLKQELQEL